MICADDFIHCRGADAPPSGEDGIGAGGAGVAGAVVSSDVRYNQLTNNGTISGSQTASLPLPVFSALPTFLTATPSTTNVSVAMNGTYTLAAGSYQDLVVGKKATVTFTGGTYHFRSISVDREAKLLFSAAAVVRVQQKVSTKVLVTIGPAAGATIDASSILFYVAGINGEPAKKTLTLDLSAVAAEGRGMLITDGSETGFQQTDLVWSADHKPILTLQPNGGFVLVIDSAKP